MNVFLLLLLVGNSCGFRLMKNNQRSHRKTSEPGLTWAAGFSHRDKDGHPAGCEAHPHSGVQTSDGGFLMVGDGTCWDTEYTRAKRLIFVVKADANGEYQWSTPIGSLGYNYGKNGVELGDGTFLVVGALSVEHSSESYPYTEHAALFRLSSEESPQGPAGTILSQTVLDNTGKDEGLLDGLMGVSILPSDASGMTVLLSGYRGGFGDFDEGHYSDDPMFLTDGGHASITKVSFEYGDSQGRVAQPHILHDKVLKDQLYDHELNKHFVAMEGMRIHVDVHNNQAVVALAAHLPTNWESFEAKHFGMVAIDLDSGHVNWSRMFVTSNEFGKGIQSHPYALTAGEGRDGYVIAGHAFSDYVEGRMILVNAYGDLVWDRRFTSRTHESEFMNTECYGVTPTQDGGYAVTCGVGVMSHEVKCLEGEVCHVWQALVHKTDGEGYPLWDQLYGDVQAHQNNAGEYIVEASDSSLAVYIDTQTWGPWGTGGNFGLLHLL